MSLKQPYFNMVKSGVKTIELRLYDKKRQQLNIGDLISFQNENTYITKKIKDLIIAKNFKTLFDTIDIKKTGFKEKDNTIKIMEKFYDNDRQNKFGVIGIVLED